jgi:hypothetical protein
MVHGEYGCDAESYEHGGGDQRTPRQTGAAADPVPARAAAADARTRADATTKVFMRGRSDKLRALD